MPPLKVLAEHPELAGAAAALEQRGRIQILRVLVRALKRDPLVDVAKLLDEMIEAEAAHPAQAEPGEPVSLAGLGRANGRN